MYRDLPMFERLDRIGELLAKGMYLYLKQKKMANSNENTAKQGGRKNTLEDARGNAKIRQLR